MASNILDYFAKTIQVVPHKTAVIDGDQSITFSELKEHAQSLAIELNALCDGMLRRPIAVFLEKSIESVTADLAILYSGNAYMNLDVKTPESRIGNILALVHPLCVVTDEKHRASLAKIWPEEQTKVITGTFLPVTKEGAYRLDAVLARMIDTDPLCLINTSGSTGTPKSVVLNHRSFIDYTGWAMELFHLSSKEILGSVAPLVFDHSSYEFCLMLMCGCTLDFMPESYLMFPAKLLQTVAEHNITYIFWVPTLMVNIANMDLLSRIQLPDLKLIWFAGEVFPTRQFNYWRRMLPQATFVNLYGPTEITVDCTYYIIDRELKDDEPIPIGFPRKNVDILVLNERNEPVVAGEEGELCVRGSCLAMGYYNNPEKTAAVFTQNPLNTAFLETIYHTGDIVYCNDYGEIVFKGRNDSLIKHAGKRIELGEIEHVLINTLQLVKNGCAVYDFDNKAIVFYYEGAEELTMAELRKGASVALPNYMIPGRFIYMRELPRNTNGKIDRLSLKKMLKS